MNTRHLLTLAFATGLLFCPADGHGDDAPGSPIVLSTTTRDGRPVIEIRHRQWGENVWELRLPECLQIHEHTDRKFQSRVRPHAAGASVTVSGIGRTSRVRFTFIVTPAADGIDIRATFSNHMRHALDPKAFASVCLDFARAPDFADSSLVGVSLPVRSTQDGRRHVALAWSDTRSHGFGDEADCVCSNPHLGAIKPEASTKVLGRIYFFSGSPHDLDHAIRGDFAQSSPVALAVEPLEVKAKARRGEVRVAVSSNDARVDLVRWYRKDVPSLPFTANDTVIDTSGSVMIHEATMETGETIAYRDASVEYGDVVAYWVRAGEYASPVQTVRVRDPRLLWGKVEVDEAVDDLHSRFPETTRVETHGETVEGWPLRSISAGNQERVVALVGGIHPGESGPEFVLPVFERFVSENNDLLEEVGVAVLPSLCADTRQRLVDGHPTYLRTNARGVDLNRNFDADWERGDSEYGHATFAPGSPTYRGDAPASEPETQATVDFLETHRPVVVISMHAPGGRLLLPPTKDAELARRFQEVSRAFRGAYAAGDTIRGAVDAPARPPGLLPLWVVRTLGVPAFDQEADDTPECKALAAHEATLEHVEAIRNRNYDALRGLLRYLGE